MIAIFYLIVEFFFVKEACVELNLIDLPTAFDCLPFFCLKFIEIHRQLS